MIQGQRRTMITACPNCGMPVCSDCGRHLNPGNVGATSTARVTPGGQRAAPRGYDPVSGQRFALFRTSPIASRRLVPNMVTWDSIKPGTNETYAHYYGVVIWVWGDRIHRKMHFSPWDSNAAEVAQILSSGSFYATPYSMLAEVGARYGVSPQQATDQMVGETVGFRFSQFDLSDPNLTFDTPYIP